MHSAASSFEFLIPNEDDPFYDALRRFKKTVKYFPVTKEEWKEAVPYLIRLVQEAIDQRPEDVIESCWKYDSQSPACNYSTYSFDWQKCYGLEHILSTPASAHDVYASSRYMPPDFFEDYPLDRLPFVPANKDGYDPSQYPQQKYDNKRKAMSYGFELIKMDPPPPRVLLPHHIYKAWMNGFLGLVRITAEHVASMSDVVNFQSRTDSSVNNVAESMASSFQIAESVASDSTRRRRFTRLV
ncbi:hypothetical protein FO519_004458 [Halicephalobus sp. NKZ332]|nr:hypothetical protein FO519_004458 [Halicephalobus sp. NKZ332]